MQQTQREQIAHALEDWYAGHARDLPWRRAGYGAWGVLVSEVMLQQTPVPRVIPRLRSWLERWPRPQDLAAAPSGDAVAAWGNLGYPRRALRLHACARAIVERHGGTVPRGLEDLLRLPGVGEYTARAVAVFAYGERHPVVDTNVRRVLARVMNGVEHPGPPSTSRDLAAMEEMLPESRAQAVAVDKAVMELGAVVCTARAPRCEECPIARYCRWHAAGNPPGERPPRRQARYEGSDRQARGALLRAVRTAGRPVGPESLEAVWGDAGQRGRALAGLLADGLVARVPSGYALPGLDGSSGPAGPSRSSSASRGTT